MVQPYRTDIIKSKLEPICPTGRQLEDALDMVIAIKENEVVMEGSSDKEIKKYDCRVELLALYRARDLLQEDIWG